MRLITSASSSVDSRTRLPKSFPAIASAATGSGYLNVAISTHIWRGTAAKEHQRQQRDDDWIGSRQKLKKESSRRRRALELQQSTVKRKENANDHGSKHHDQRHQPWNREIIWNKFILHHFSKSLTTRP